MREVLLTITIDGLTSQDYYAAIYATPTPFQQFHKASHRDAAPGVDAISVTETQRLTWHGTGGGFTITSEPSLNFPGSQKFVTKGEIIVSNIQGGCQVSCTMFCSASMPWPKSLNGFLSFCQGLCEASKAARLQSPPTLPQQPQPAAPLPSVPIVPAAALAAVPFAAPQPAQVPVPAREDSLLDVASTIGDMYYDADQTGAMLQHMQQLQEASASGARSLSAIVEQLREMNSHLAAIRGVSPSSDRVSSGVQRFKGLASSSSSPASARAGRTWVLLLGVTAVSTSAAVWYWRGKHRGGLALWGQ